MTSRNALTIRDPEYKTQFQLSLNVKTQSTDGTLWNLIRNLWRAWQEWHGGKRSPRVRGPITYCECLCILFLSALRKSNAGVEMYGVQRGPELCQIINKLFLFYCMIYIAMQSCLHFWELSRWKNFNEIFVTLGTLIVADQTFLQNDVFLNAPHVLRLKMSSDWSWDSLQNIKY